MMQLEYLQQEIISSKITVENNIVSMNPSTTYLKSLQLDVNQE